MTLFVIAASALVFSWKFFGYLVPERFLTPRVRAFTERVTIALLAALVVSQAVISQGEIVIDARLAAVAVAAFLLWRKAPFIVVVVVAALVAGGLRFLGF